MLMVKLHIFMCASSLFMQNDVLLKNIFLHLRVRLHFTVYVPHSFFLYEQDILFLQASSYTSQFPNAKSKPHCSIALVSIAAMYIQYSSVAHNNNTRTHTHTHTALTRGSADSRNGNCVCVCVFFFFLSSFFLLAVYSCSSTIHRIIFVTYT
jgi:hypothetical protein